MNIVVGSAFRNSTHYLNRYFNQVQALQEHLEPRHRVRIIAAEGDSTDNTRLALTRPGVQLVDVTHGKRLFGSTEEEDRLVTLSKIGNAIFESVKPTDDILVYVESDLVWDPVTMGQLIAHAVKWSGGFDVFAPLVMAGPHFYDIWGFRKNGVRFGPFIPFHPELRGGLTEIDSAGSCLVMRSVVAQKCRIWNNYCLVGWCEDARKHGYRIAVCADLKINHP